MRAGREERRDRHLLLAVDGSDAAEKAVIYVADFLGEMPGFKVTLLHVLAVPQEDFFDSEKERTTWMGEQEAIARRFLERYRLILTEAGVPGEKITVRIVPSGDTTVPEAVLDEHRKAGSCTIVVGRGGKSREEEFLFGSVSSRIVHRAQGCSVWVIEG